LPELRAKSAFSVAEWQFESGPREWAGLPAERGAELLKCFEAYAKGGAATVSMKSGVEEYRFDFGLMKQTNTRTGKCRSIRCQLDVPASWTRCVDLQSIYQRKPPKSVSICGFPYSACDGIYTQSAFYKINLHPVWWKNTGDYFIYVAGATLRLWVVTDDWLARKDTIEKGGLLYLAVLIHSTDPLLGHEWLSSDLSPANSVQATIARSIGMPPLMEIAVEVSDHLFHETIRQLMHDSVTHDRNYTGLSCCNSFQTGLRISRILRIENWHLWAKYCNHKRHIQHDLLNYNISVDSTRSCLPEYLRTFSRTYGDLEENVCECFLFHGTSYDTALKIAFEGFDFRLNQHGFYGRGTYFASQACKSHQYTQALERDSMRAAIISRVVVGDVAFAEKVDRACQRPPHHAGTLRCCDTVVAKPGPMPGHKQEVQTHQEFVIFEKFQAYPELIVEYVVDGV